MVSDHLWEEPLAKPLYVTFRRAAELLGVPYWRMSGLAYVLDTRYFGEKGGAPRISLASIEEFIDIRDAGDDPAKVMASRRSRAGWDGFSTRQPAWTPPAPTYWQRRRRWRHF